MRWRIGLVGLALAGCPRLDPYFCSTQQDCDRDGREGVCLEDDTCAYPVGTDVCASGLMRSPNAAFDPGECVDTGETTGPIADGGTSTGEPPGSSGDDGSGESGEPLPCSTVAITVDTNVLSGDEVLADYPLLVRLDDPAIVSAVREAGANPRWLDASGTELPAEIAEAEADPDALLAHVRLPAYELGAQLPLTLAWGGDPATTSATDVWSRFRGVWHLDDIPTGVDGDVMRNAVVVGEPGLTQGAMAAEQSVPGVIGRGLSFDGIDDGVFVDAAFIGTLTDYTISLWARHEDDDDDPWSSYFQRLNGDFFYPRCWRHESANVSCQFRLLEPDTIVFASGDFDHFQGELIHLAMSRDASAAQTRVYVNGQRRSTIDEEALTLASGDFQFEIGHGEWGSATAMLDEVRVSDEALPDAWIAADYATGLDPTAALASIGPISPTGCP